MFIAVVSNHVTYYCLNYGINLKHNVKLYLQWLPLYLQSLYMKDPSLAELQHRVFSRCGLILQ